MKPVLFVRVSLFSLAVALLLMGGSGCPQPLPPTPPPGPAVADAGVVDVPVASSPCERACANLAFLKCPEGLDTACVQVCTRTQGSGITDLKPECLAKATSQYEAEVCGSVRCRPMRLYVGWGDGAASSETQ
jgi:hypothetical protein